MHDMVKFKAFLTLSDFFLNVHKKNNAHSFLWENGTMIFMTLKLIGFWRVINCRNFFVITLVKMNIFSNGNERDRRGYNGKMDSEKERERERWTVYESLYRSVLLLITDCIYFYSSLLTMSINFWTSTIRIVNYCHHSHRLLLLPWPFQ